MAFRPNQGSQVTTILSPQVQENKGNNARGQSRNSYSDENVFQGQSVNQDSDIVSENIVIRQNERIMLRYNV